MNQTPEFVAWDSQPLEAWRQAHGQGEVVSLDGRDTHYRVSGQGRDIILIHGFFFDSTCWIHNIDVLARHCRVCVPDLWGFGYSTREPMQYSYPLYASQLKLLMDKLNICRAVLVGQSLGAGVAIEFCVRYPDRVDKLVLVDAAGMPNPEPFTARLFMLPGVGEALLKLPVDVIRRRMLDDFFLFDPGTVPPALFRELVCYQKISGSIAAALTLMRLRFADRLEHSIGQLARQAKPTLVVWGEQDKAISIQTGMTLHALLPGAEFSSIGQAGHVPNLERPDVFNRRILKFLLG